MLIYVRPSLTPEPVTARPVSPPTPGPNTPAVARALDTPRLTLAKIGQAVGASRFALEKYRNGQRALPETLRLRLIAYLEAHARQVLADATALRG